MLQLSKGPLLNCSRVKGALHAKTHRPLLSYGWHYIKLHGGKRYTCITVQVWCSWRDITYIATCAIYKRTVQVCARMRMYGSMRMFANLFAYFVIHTLFSHNVIHVFIYLISQTKQLKLGPLFIHTLCDLLLCDKFTNKQTLCEISFGILYNCVPGTI